MIGIIAILLVSWGLLYLLQGKNLRVLGFLPISKRSIQFIIGFFFSLLLNGLIVWTQAEVLQLEWRLQDTVEISAIVQSLWYHFTSALTEELVFRGAILYILFTFKMFRL